ncbi:hypothetical protein [Aromatoleum evansii]|uniref:hypothetical protein n=1 Tax=Aromatoleum evansii TaxID=59406 RepID=UPI00145D6639|nr:hypothetical protein [Aromatoleum evansii]NMG28396.1 hypothetical protein [Aromatoleum evansii]
MEQRLDFPGVHVCAQTVLGDQPVVVLCDVGESFDYQPERHFFAVPADAPALRYEFAVAEKVVPDNHDPRRYAWQPVDGNP